MKTIMALLVLAAILAVGATAGNDQGKRLAGPFCIDKVTGTVHSVSAWRACKGNQVRKEGLAGSIGPKGEKGDTGTAGPTGAKGDTGAAGNDGLDGVNGSPGIIDVYPTECAPVDEQEVSGDGYDGVSQGCESVCPFGGYEIVFTDFPVVDICNGVPGERGPRGYKGYKGATGDKGDKGDTGPQGEPGKDGAPGEKGDTGDPGPKGDTGDTGPKGDTGDVGPAVSTTAANICVKAGLDVVYGPCNAVLLAFGYSNKQMYLVP